MIASVNLTPCPSPWKGFASNVILRETYRAGRPKNLLRSDTREILRFAQNDRKQCLLGTFKARPLGKERGGSIFQGAHPLEPPSEGDDPLLDFPQRYGRV
jgi:hypothetical protein